MSDAKEVRSDDPIEEAPAKVPGVRKSKAGLLISSLLMLGWLAFLVYLAIRLGS